MKTVKQFYLITAILIISISTKSTGQFVPASAPHVSLANPVVNGRATGNDILDFGGDTYEVSVWEDANGTVAGIGYNVIGSGSYGGYVPFNNSTAGIDPDVCLAIDGNGDVCAIAVYYFGGSYYIETFVFSGGSCTFADDDVVIGTFTFGTAVNIDSDYSSSDFIVVFDDGSNNDLYAYTGILSTSGIIAPNYGGYPVGIGSQGGKGNFPDVAYTRTASDEVYISYTTSGLIVIDNDLYSGITSGTNGCSAVYATGYSGTILTTRIACPDLNSGGTSSKDWSMVFHNIDNSGFHNIIGYTVSGSVLYGPTTYNDGSYVTGYDLTSELNYSPAITYTTDGANNPNIFVGWTFYNLTPLYSSPTAVEASYSIGVICDQTGIPVNGDYWEIPTAPHATETWDYVSLAARNANNTLMCTYYYMDGSEVFSKIVSTINGASSLKITNESEINKRENYIGFVYELTGKIIFRTESNSFEGVDSGINSFLKTVRKSIFLKSIVTESGSCILNTKLANLSE